MPDIRSIPDFNQDKGYWIPVHNTGLMPDIQPYIYTGSRVLYLISGRILGNKGRISGLSLD